MGYEETKDRERLRQLEYMIDKSPKHQEIMLKVTQEAQQKAAFHEADERKKYLGNRGVVAGDESWQGRRKGGEGNGGPPGKGKGGVIQGQEERGKEERK